MITKTNNAKHRLVDDVFFKTQTSAKLDRIEDKLDSLIADAQPKDVYTTKGAVRLLKRKQETIQRLCREGRLLAHRAGGGRGGIEEWRITHAEIERYRKEGPRM